MGAGRPTYDRERDLLNIVFSLLPTDGQPVRWTELLHGARAKRLSPTTLGKKLSELEAAGAVNREIDQSKKPPAVTYRCARKERQFDMRAEPSRVEKMLRWLKEERLDIDRFIFATTLVHLSALMLYVTMALYEAFYIREPELLLQGDTTKAFAPASERTHPPQWIVDRVIDIYTRPRMQGLITFLKTKDPRTGKPIHESLEVWKAVREAESLVGTSLPPETESEFLGSLYERYSSEKKRLK